MSMITKNYLNLANTNYEVLFFKDNVRITCNKILHMGNTRHSYTCVIQEYRIYTMSQYNGCCQYHESTSIPWILANTMSPCLYHESMCIPRVNVNTISPGLYHESMSIPWVLVNFMHPCLYHESLPIILVNVYTMSPEIQITEINKQKNIIFGNTERDITGIQKNKLEKFWNTCYRSTKLQMTKI